MAEPEIYDGERKNLDELLQLVLSGGRQFGRDEGQIPGGAIQPGGGGGMTPASMASGAARGLPAPAAAPPSSSVATGTMPEQPRMDPRYQDVQSQRAALRLKVDENDPKFKPKGWETALASIAAGMMTFGRVPGAMEAADKAINWRKYNEEDRRAALAESLAGEATGMEKALDLSQRRYNNQMQQLEAQHRMKSDALAEKKASNTFDSDRYMKAGPDGKARWYKRSQTGEEIEVGPEKSTAPASFAAGIMSDDPAVQKRAREGVAFEAETGARMRAKYRVGDGEGESKADKRAAKFKGIEGTKDLAMSGVETEVAAAIEAEKRKDGYSALPAGMKKKLDAKYSEMEPTLREKKQRKIEGQFGKDVTGAGGSYTPGEPGTPGFYPNWTKRAVGSIVGNNSANEAAPAPARATQRQSATATPPAAAAPEARVAVQKGGEKFSVPQSQLKEALRQGYKEIKKR